MKDIHIKFSAPLRKGDTESQTYGCRANNPSICKYAYLEGICAFVSKDGLCKNPSKAWKKQYEKLKGEANDS